MTIQLTGQGSDRERVSLEMPWPPPPPPPPGAEIHASFKSTWAPSFPLKRRHRLRASHHHRGCPSVRSLSADWLEWDRSKRWMEWTAILLLEQQRRRMRNSHYIFQFPPTLRSTTGQDRIKSLRFKKEGRRELIRPAQLFCADSAVATLISINSIVVTETATGDEMPR